LASRAALLGCRNGARTLPRHSLPSNVTGEVSGLLSSGVGRAHYDCLPRKRPPGNRNGVFEPLPIAFNAA
jgi:hypothetical protein